MSTPRLEVRLDDLAHNTRTLADRLGRRGIAVCAVTKATLGSPTIARVLLEAGAATLGESRIENIESLRRGGIDAEIMMIRGPMLSQVDRVVEHASVSLNSELVVVEALSAAAVRRNSRHRVVLMVELGDLREGVMPADVPAFVDRVAAMAGVELVGVGTNLACQNGVVPDRTNMAELASVAAIVEGRTGTKLQIVSGGNSANLDWALDPDQHMGAVNHLRLGESILLGREPTQRRPIDGLRTDAFTLVAEVIESKKKPRQPWGVQGQAAFTSDPIEPAAASGSSTGECSGVRRVLVAVGRQDVDPAGLTPPAGLRLVGASSDHLILESTSLRPPPIGAELRFGLDYAALVRASTSPFVEHEYVVDR